MGIIRNCTIGEAIKLFEETFLLVTDASYDHGDGNDLSHP